MTHKRIQFLTGTQRLEATEGIYQKSYCLNKAYLDDGFKLM